MHVAPGPLSAGTAAFPQAAPWTGALGETNHDNIVYSCEPGYRPLFLDLRVPPGPGTPHPLIVWVHGGGWLFGSRRRLPPNLFQHRLHDRMLEAGYAVAAVDYRLARETGLPGMLLDLKAAIRWLRAHAVDFDLDPERVTVWGESAGAHLALMLAMCTDVDDLPRTGEFLDQSERPQAIVDWYGPSDFETLAGHWTPTDSEEVGRTAERPHETLQQSSSWTYAQLSPVSYVRPDLPPIFVAHGTGDSQVPVDQSRTLVDRLRRAGATVEYLEVPGAEHVWVGAASVADIVDRSVDFLSRHTQTLAAGRRTRGT
jgi:acetyl esterase/lipase